MKGKNIMIRATLVFCFFFVTATAVQAANSCRDCHENRIKMEALGYGHFSVTQQEVEEQSHMPATCNECHLGNPAESDGNAAHKGMARLLVVSKKGLAAGSSPRAYPLEYGTNPVNRISAVADKGGKKVKDASVAAISWHDKNPGTLSQDFSVMKKTCGACHEKEFDEFSRSTMATNGKQSQYKGWTDKKRGPHDCGPWFEGNFDTIQQNTAVTMSPESQRINQKACNICHVGCLDCHFNPQKKSPTDRSKGAHSFMKTPTSESCYGNGRASICHAGPEDRRRGAGYFGDSFSFPEGSTPDVHLKAKVGCLDCHESSKSNQTVGHATVKRQAQGSCVRCHAEAVKSHAASLHKNLSCEACHIQNVGGYQATYWGPGKMAGTATTYFKFKAYYGYMPEPILIKDQKGRWIPVKPFPMAVMNQKTSPFVPGLYWRFPAELPDLQRTDDAWAYVGLFGGLPDNNKALLWIQMDKMSHKLGKSRSCDSCHTLPDGTQIQEVTWKYSDPGALPFSGSHEVFANKDGLFIRKMQSEKINLEPGYKLSALAPWAYLKDKWQVRGDFSLPQMKDRNILESVQKNPGSAQKSGIVHR
ncbi:cytochrome C [Oryzomonas japonica]|uniref:Cytochrome C n=1 Tax=Oryzomonas japonica TaxID=2603858 RepID=A0A7J4ZM09_9BACT|nr:cytochrome c3 family protein [Oryzomonas japonica]KAB0663408.1 cytochrome C [Oryzomonas japonica]